MKTQRKNGEIRTIQECRNRILQTNILISFLIFMIIRAWKLSSISDAINFGMVLILLPLLQTIAFFSSKMNDDQNKPVFYRKKADTKSYIGYAKANARAICVPFIFILVIVFLNQMINFMIFLAQKDLFIFDITIIIAIIVGVYTVVFQFAPAIQNDLERGLFYRKKESPLYRNYVKKILCSVFCILIYIFFQKCGDSALELITDDLELIDEICLCMKNISIMLWIILFGFMLIDIFRYLLIENNQDKRIANRVEYFFWNKRVYNLSNREWDVYKTEKIMEYVLNKYFKVISRKKLCKGINLCDFDKIEFDSICNNAGGKKYLLKMRRKIILFTIFLCLICIFQIYTLVNSNQRSLALVVLFETLIICIPLYFSEYEKIKERFLSNSFIYIWGYFIHSNNNVYFVNSYTGHKFKQFVLWIKRVICFFNLVLQTDDSTKLKNTCINLMLDYYTDKKMESSCRNDTVMLMIPIIICVDLTEGKLDSSVDKRVKDCLIDIGLSQEEKTKICAIEKAILRDLYGDDLEFAHFSSAIFSRFPCQD